MSGRILAGLNPLEEMLLALDSGRRSALRILVSGRKNAGKGPHEKGMIDYIAAGLGGRSSAYVESTPC